MIPVLLLLWTSCAQISGPVCNLVGNTRISHLKWPTCAAGAPSELSDFQHIAYRHIHIQQGRSCAFLLSRACRDIEQFLDEERYLRQKAAKHAMQFAWQNYVELAWGKDVIKPVSGNGSNVWGGFGMTLVDALDTLALMKMDNDYTEAVGWIRDHLRFDQDINVNVFEATIRLLGGLLGAYALRGDSVLLEKAEDLGNRLQRAFSRGEARLPFSDINLHTGIGEDASGYSSPAEVYVPLEWSFLAEASGKCQFADGVDNVLKLIRNKSKLLSRGVVPIMLDMHGNDEEHTKNQNYKFAFGARADSFYEYLLKAWLWSNEANELAREAYRAFLLHFPSFLVPTGHDSIGVVEKKLKSTVAKMDHLACFLPGVFALDRLFGRTSSSYEWAHGLAKTCYRMYNRTATFLAPEISILSKTEILDDVGSMHNLLRPETLESLFLLSVSANQQIRMPGLMDKNYLQQITYENWGWDIFMAFQRSSRTRFGYSAVENVQASIAQHSDDTPSFFFAETLKYAFLLFSPKEEAFEILQRFVLTTEAHFIPRSSGVCVEQDEKTQFEKFVSLFSNITNLVTV